MTGVGVAFKVTLLILSLAILGVGIYTLVTVIDIQSDEHAAASTSAPATGPTTGPVTGPTPAATTKSPDSSATIFPAPQPITEDDPRYSTYKSFADLLKTWMDTSRDPCNDYYNYVCGAAKEGQPMSFDESDELIQSVLLSKFQDDPDYFKTASLPVQQAKWVYDRCTNFTITLNDLYARSKRTFDDILSGTGAQFPALFSNETVALRLSADAMAQLLGYPIGASGATTLIDMYVDTDWKDPHNAAGGYALLIDQPATFFSATTYTKLWNALYREEVIEEVVGVLESAAYLYNVSIARLATREAATAIVDLDYALAMNYSTDETTRRQYDRMYNPYTLDQLNTVAPFVEWNKFIQLTPVSKSVPVNGSFRVIVNELDNLIALNQDVVSRKINPATLNNYVFVHILRGLSLPSPPSGNGLTKESHLIKERAEKRGSRIRRQPKVDLEQRIIDAITIGLAPGACAELTVVLQWANSRVFTDAAYPTQAARDTVRQQANSVIRSILTGFRYQIDILNWMSPASKKGAYNKIDNLVVNIAFPDWVTDDAQLTDYYKARGGLDSTTLTLKQNDDLLTMVDEISAFSLVDAFSALASGPADRRDFSGPAAITNAWYQPEMNSITFPGGILHAPFYDSNYPSSVNFGGLGVIAGHELTHGFDDEGVQWDGTGVLNGWMDDTSLGNFTTMANCVVKEYDGFCPIVNNATFCVDGGQTQGENIADNGGIQAAWKAFKSYEALNGPDPLLPGEMSVFSPAQLFFLSFAQVWCQYPPTDDQLQSQLLTDPHSPSIYRVWGTIENFPAFRVAYNCPVGDDYTPADHCDVWTSAPSEGSTVDADGIPVVAQNDVNVAPAEQINPRDMAQYDAYQSSLKLLMASSNLSIDPCNDFYNYGCGAYPGSENTFYDLDNQNSILINNQINSAAYAPTMKSSAALTKLQNFYDACIAETTNSTLTNDYVTPKILGYQAAIGEDIPLLGGTGITPVDASQLGSALGYLSFTQGLDTLVTPMIDTNWSDPVGYGYMLHIDQTSARYLRSYYEDDAWATTKPTYVDQITAALKAYIAFVATKDPEFTLPADYATQIDNVVEFERSIVMNYTCTDAESRQYQRQWNVKAADAWPAQIDWTAYFSYAPATADTFDQLNFNEFDLTTALLTNFLPGKDDLLVNYLFTRLLLDNAGLIPSTTTAEWQAVRREITKKPIPTSHGRSRLPRHFSGPSLADVDDDVHVACASATAALDNAQGRVYIDARFPTEYDRERIRNSTFGVIQNVISAMQGMLIELDWMDEETKKNALKKAANIQINVAFPDFILDNAQLDASYATLNLTGLNYYGMLDAITVFDIQKQFAQLSVVPADRTDFLGQTSVVNAWYQPELNSITFPAGILQQPYFDVDYPAGLNYGAMAIVAGHELTHGFDDEGVQWNYEGALETWMDAQSTTGFNTMAQCVIDQYSTFCPLNATFSPNCTNGVNTQGENIADNGGIHAAWRAYQAHVELDGPDPLFSDRVFSQFSEDQLFFLNFAQVWCMSPAELTTDFIYNRLMTDPHSLGPYRVEGSLQNLPAFRARFNCPLNSTYAPANHCNVWVPTYMA